MMLQQAIGRIALSYGVVKDLQVVGINREQSSFGEVVPLFAVGGAADDLIAKRDASGIGLYFREAWYRAAPSGGGVVLPINNWPPKLASRVTW
jgi:hypothetical protein